MVPSLLSGLTSVVPAVIAPLIPNIPSEPFPTPSPEPSPAGPVALSGHQAMKTRWLVEKLPLALLILLLVASLGLKHGFQDKYFCGWGQ